MRVFITAKSKSKKEYVKQLGETHFEVAVNEPPEKGKANNAIIKALAKHLGVPQIDIVIVSGATSKQKIVEIVTP